MNTDYLTKMTTNGADNTEKILYDGSLDTMYPNNIVVTDKQMTRNKVAEFTARVSRVEIYRDFIIVYSSYLSDDPIILFGSYLYKFVDVNIVSKISRQYDYGHCSLIGENQTIEHKCFLYDHFLFIVRVHKDTLICYQRDTETNTRCSITEDEYEEFAKVGINQFIRAWHQLPFGSKRTFDSTLLKSPKTIYAEDTPAPARVYNKQYADLDIIFD